MRVRSLTVGGDHARGSTVKAYNHWSCRRRWLLDLRRPRGTLAVLPVLEIESAGSTHNLMADLLVLALACDQTRVFNLNSWRLFTDVRFAGEDVGYHQLTHDEPIDPSLGYQPSRQRFLERAFGCWNYLLGALDSIEEGDGTLLDTIALFAHSSTEFPKEHGTQNIPMMVAGSAGGRLNTGLHVRGNASPTSRVALTLQQALRVPVGTWVSASPRPARRSTS